MFIITIIKILLEPNTTDKTCSNVCRTIKKTELAAVGFEPTPPKRLVP